MGVPTVKWHVYRMIGAILKIKNIFEGSILHNNTWTARMTGCFVFLGNKSID